jgi:hypothetical protein
LEHPVTSAEHLHRVVALLNHSVAEHGIGFGWSLIAGIMGAGVTYGVTTAKVNSAHAKIEAEKVDRIQSVSGLKADMNRGFDHIERQLEAQTKTVIDALRERK